MTAPRTHRSSGDSSRRRRSGDSRPAARTTTPRAASAPRPAPEPQPAPPLEGELLLAAREIFGDQLELARRYTEHLASSGIVRGLIGPREAPRLWERHVLNCAVVARLIPRDARVVDVGSGAGLPGLCLAIARPDVTITLVEPLERRVTWLHEVVSDLGLANVRILRDRAEAVREQVGPVDVVTARAVSALVGLVDLTLPLLKGSGELLALKGRSAEDEMRQARKKFDRYGVRDARVETVGDDILGEPTTVVRVRL